MHSIACENVVKIFGRGKTVRALDHFSLEVEPGEVFGLLGPNGSGKTTFVRCCLNIIFPSSGKLRVLGRRPGHPRTTLEIGYLPESPNFYDHLTGRAFLSYHAELARIPIRERRKRVDEMLDKVKLDESASRRRLRTYSKGMLQRIGLAQALINRPKLVFLDEPQTGLDPIGRHQIKDIMREAAQSGSTILFSSHVLGDVEDVADRVAIIDKGSVRRVSTLKELILSENQVVIRLRPKTGKENAGKTMDENDPDFTRSVISVVERVGAMSPTYENGYLTSVLTGEKDIPPLVTALCASGFDVFEVMRKRSTLEETFLKEFSEIKKPVDESAKKVTK